MLKTLPTWDLEEYLIGSGMAAMFAGVWLRWDLGLALTVTGASVLILGCIIVFGK